MAAPVRFALLRDGPTWAFAVPAGAVLADDDTIVLAAGATSVVLESGRLDAGVDSDWERLRVRLRAPEQGGVTLDTFASADANAAPTWRREPGLNVLLDRASAPAGPTGAWRYLWVRLTLTRLTDESSPALQQVQAQTTGRSYLEDLPAVYGRRDAPTRFLQRWLDLVRSDLEGFEQALAEAPALFDPRMAPAGELDWVAHCLGFEPPPHLTPSRLRELLLRVPALYERRGTVGGLADWAEVWTGQRPIVLEAWRARRVWQLETTSRLGFDTMLPAAAPDGLVVPGTPLTDPAYLGLMREMYTGATFDATNGNPRIDATLDVTIRPLEDAKGQQVAPSATLRWSGQVKPRFPERYTLALRLEGGSPGDDIRIRFWVDGVALIDNLWADAASDAGGQRPAASTVSRDVSVRLEEIRWYALRLDVRTTAKSLKVSLSWSSRSQRPETVPGACLYALVDERADTAQTRASGFEVGSAVVGEGGPQSPEDFGQGLFGATAHLFTVLALPACGCQGDRRRRLREVLDAEKPAHTDYHLCFVKPRLRVGFQARLGIDAIVGDGPAPMRLGENVLGRDSFMAAMPTPPTELDPKEQVSWTR